jgi:hypothetical protein
MMTNEAWMADDARRAPPPGVEAYCSTRLLGELAQVDLEEHDAVGEATPLVLCARRLLLLVRAWQSLVASAALWRELGEQRRRGKPVGKKSVHRCLQDVQVEAR